MGPLYILVREACGETRAQSFQAPLVSTVVVWSLFHVPRCKGLLDNARRTTLVMAWIAQVEELPLAVPFNQQDIDTSFAEMRLLKAGILMLESLLP